MVAAAEPPRSDATVAGAVDPDRVQGRGAGRLSQPRVRTRVDDGPPVGRDRGTLDIARPVLRAWRIVRCVPRAEIEQLERSLLDPNPLPRSRAPAGRGPRSAGRPASRLAQSMPQAPNVQRTVITPGQPAACRARRGVAAGRVAAALERDQLAVGRPVRLVVGRPGAGRYLVRLTCPVWIADRALSRRASSRKRR